MNVETEQEFGRVSGTGNTEEDLAPSDCSQDCRRRSLWPLQEP